MGQMVRDDGATGPATPTGGAPATCLAIDGDVVAAVGNRLVDAGESVQIVSRQGVLTGRSGWSDVQLEAAGTRFHERFGYLLGQLGQEVTDAGQHLRDSAASFGAIDGKVAATFEGVGSAQ